MESWNLTGGVDELEFIWDWKYRLWNTAVVHGCNFLFSHDFKPPVIISRYKIYTSKSHLHMLSCKRAPLNSHTKGIQKISAFCIYIVEIASTLQNKQGNIFWQEVSSFGETDQKRLVICKSEMKIIDVCKQLPWEFVYLLSNTETQLISCFCNFATPPFVCNRLMVWSIAILLIRHTEGVQEMLRFADGEDWINFVGVEVKTLGANAINQSITGCWSLTTCICVTTTLFYQEYFNSNVHDYS